MNDFKFKLGETVKDALTGQQGVIIARTQYLTSCNTYGLIRPEAPKTEDDRKWLWFDEPRLIPVKGKKIISLFTGSKAENRRSSRGG
jgi:hypothetical protein